MKRALFLTGGPGVGKTTIIKEALALPAEGLARARVSAGGFYTEEMRSGGVRQGFKLTTLHGQSTVLAHLDIKSQYRVSKYGVNLEGLEGVGVAAIRQAIQDSAVVVIDEVGKMELFSPSCREAVTEALASGKRVLGTIMLAPHPWADAIKRRPEVEVVTVTRANRDQVAGRVRRWLESM